MGVFSDFIKNFRDTVNRQNSIKGNQTFDSVQKQEPTKVWGFEQDRKNYSDAGSKEAGGDPEKLDWMSYTVNDNDNGRAMRIDVGYDEDGKISGVRNFTSENSATGYYGAKAISDFFKNNFDMDATRYTVSSAPVDIFLPSKIPQEYHNKATVFFDSDDDGAFIPSMVFSPNNYGVRNIGDRKSTLYTDRPDREARDFLENYRQNKIMGNTFGNALRIGIDADRSEASDNGTLFMDEFNSTPLSVDDTKSFLNGAKDFTDMLLQYSGTDNADARRQLLTNAYKTFGGNERFRAYLDIIARGEESREYGYDGYDYRKIFEQIGPWVASTYKRLTPRA